MDKKRGDEKQSIVAERSEKTYFHMMLNMADDELNPSQYRLLGHYVRWAGQGGQCEEGIRETARVTRMGKDTIRKTRTELENMGYIRVISPTAEEQKQGIPTVIVVRDRWAENVQRYQKGVPNQAHPIPNQVHLSDETCTQSGTPPVPNQAPTNNALEERIEKQEYSPAPIGTEETPTAFKPFIETELFEESATEEITEQQAYDLAVCYFFGIKHPTLNNNKGWSHVRKMGNFFRGKIGQDKPNDAFKEFQFKEEPFTALEIIGMKLWWTDQFDDISMLQKPATIAEKETIFRPTYDGKLEARAQRRLEKEKEKVFGIKAAEPAPKRIPVDVDKTSSLIADIIATLD